MDFEELIHYPLYSSNTEKLCLSLLNVHTLLLRKTSRECGEEQIIYPMSTYPPQID